MLLPSLHQLLALARKYVNQVARQAHPIASERQIIWINNQT